IEVGLVVDVALGELLPGVALKCDARTTERQAFVQIRRCVVAFPARAEEVVDRREADFLRGPGIVVLIQEVLAYRKRSVALAVKVGLALGVTRLRLTRKHLPVLRGAIDVGGGDLARGVESFLCIRKLNALEPAQRLSPRMIVEPRRRAILGCMQ